MLTKGDGQTITRRSFVKAGGLLLAVAPALAACSSAAGTATPAPSAPTKASAASTSVPSSPAKPTTVAATAVSAAATVPAATTNSITSGAMKGDLSVMWWAGASKPGTFDEWDFIAKNYKLVRPDINLKVIRIPWESCAQWIQTQLAANTLPDLLIWYEMPTTQQEATNTSPWLSLDDYLKDRSTYTKKPWIEDIDVGLAKIYYGALRHQYGIPITDPSVRD